MKNFKLYLEKANKIEIKASHSGVYDGDKGMFYTLHKGSFEIDEVLFISRNGAVLFKDDKKDKVLKTHKDITKDTAALWINDIFK